MSGIAGVKIKIMPDSPETNIEDLEKKIKTLIEKSGGRNRRYEIQPVAFGLKSIISFFEWPEEKSLEELENKLQNLKNVGSIQVIDMRKIA